MDSPLNARDNRRFKLSKAHSRAKTDATRAAAKDAFMAAINEDIADAEASGNIAEVARLREVIATYWS